MFGELGSFALRMKGLGTDAAVAGAKQFVLSPLFTYVQQTLLS